jgi:hypothetical protein
LVLFVASLSSASAADRITATIAITNTAGTTNGQTIQIVAGNTTTRTWTNSVTVPASQIFTNSTAAGAATNLYKQLVATAPLGVAPILMTTSTNVVLYGVSGIPLAITLSAGYGTVSYATSSVSPAAYTVRIPNTVESAAQKTNVASALVDWFNLSAATNQANPSAPAFALFASLSALNSSSNSLRTDTINATNKLDTDLRAYTLDATNKLNTDLRAALQPANAALSNVVNIASNSYLGSFTGNLAGGTNLNGSAVIYATNTSPVRPDFWKPYQMFQTNADFLFLSPTNVDVGKTQFQSCAVFVTNSTAAEIAVTFPASIHAQGTANVTNLSAFTFSQYGQKWTNVVCFPMY